jgi:hypothetical protein
MYPHGNLVQILLWRDAWRLEQWSKSKRPLPANSWVNVFPSITRISVHCYTTVLVTMVHCWKPISMATNCWKHSNGGMGSAEGLRKEAGQNQSMQLKSYVWGSWRVTCKTFSCSQEAVSWTEFRRQLNSWSVEDIISCVIVTAISRVL